MASVRTRWKESTDADLVDRWFRALDQRRLHVGLREWLLQVTGIHVEKGEVWIQIANGLCHGASILLRVSAATSVERALSTLTQRHLRVSQGYPIVVNATRVSRESRHDGLTARVGSASHRI